MRKLVCGLLLMVAAVQCQYNNTDATKDKIIHTVNTVEKTMEATRAALDIFGIQAERFTIKDLTVKENGSFYELLSTLGMGAGEIYEVAREAEGVIDVRSLRPNQ